MGGVNPHVDECVCMCWWKGNCMVESVSEISGYRMIQYGTWYSMVQNGTV